MILKKYYKTEEEFEEFHATLKRYPCPHCHLSGCLILHGYLYGFSDMNTGRVNRGRRIFCSNRNKRGGCGKTFSVLIADYIKNFMISAKSVWRFLEGVKDGSCLAEAFRALNIDMKGTSAYSIFRKFKYSQTHIRTLLSDAREPPKLKRVKDPVIQTITHLQSAFKEYSCPVAQFQYHFQASFF